MTIADIAFKSSSEHLPSAAVKSTKTAIKKADNYSVHPAPNPIDVPGFSSFNRRGLFTGFLVAPIVTSYLIGGSVSLGSYLVLFVIMLLPVYAGFMILDSYAKNWAFAQTAKNVSGLKITDFMEFRDESLKAQYGHADGRIPIETFYEAYFDGKIDLKGDMLDVLENRHDWTNYRFTLGHLKFFIQNFVPEVSLHTRAQDKEQVQDHYDRGNDFYDAFLGPMMIYTSGIITDMTRRQSLEELQLNKLNLIFEKIQLKRDEKLLDIGCGWGTLLVHAAEKYGAHATGVTLAKQQTQFGLQRAKQHGVAEKVKILNHDYRDIPRSDAPNGVKYNKITCLEMAEHVGVLKFNTFLNQVSELLADDGVFYLQIAGLRRPWQYEDLLWGLFMNKYVFPGADASCPLAWVISKLEYAGFEVQSVDTIGVHYSATLERWYQNWMKPDHKERIVAKYTERQWRIWEFFLAWSTIISRQGSATCYQLVCHKNSNTLHRSRFIEGYGAKRLTA